MPLKISAFPKCYIDRIAGDRTMSVFDWIEMARSLDADGLEMYDGFFASLEPDYLDRVGEAIRAAVPAGREVALVLENDRNEARFLPLPYDAQWTDDWHHCVHVLLTGEKQGYYSGFQDPARQLLDPSRVLVGQQEVGKRGLSGRRRGHVIRPLCGSGPAPPR